MTLILDAGGVSSLASKPGHLVGWFAKDSKERAQVPAIVLTEVLTGDHRRDHKTNRLLRLCEIVDVDEELAREGALLRTLTRRAGTISATDAVVAALAGGRPDPIVLTSDPKDLTSLTEDFRSPVTINVV